MDIKQPPISYLASLSGKIVAYAIYGGGKTRQALLNSALSIAPLMHPVSPHLLTMLWAKTPTNQTLNQQKKLLQLDQNTVNPTPL